MTKLFPSILPEGSADVCGTVMTDGERCERPAEECPYHD